MRFQSMVQVEKRTDGPSIESILDKIGSVKYGAGAVVSAPYDDDGENETWLRKRVVHLRQVIEHHPSHESALACLVQLEDLEASQPFLFLEVEDPVDTQEFEITGLYRPEDFDNEEYYSDWREALAPINKRHDDRARRILAEYPELGLSEWAYQHLIRSLSMKLFNTLGGGDIKEIERLTDEISDTTENYVRYRLEENTSIEPFDGYFNFGSKCAVDFMIRAIDALQPKGRTAQSALLDKLTEPYPDDEDVRSYTYKFNSFEKPFELSFVDLVSGNSVDIQEYRGKVVIVDFWAMWCRPCLDFVPFLKQLRTENPNEVEVFGISCDDDRLDETATTEERNKLKKAVVECASKHKMDWPIALSAKFHQKWRITGIPTIFVVDRRGILRSLDARTSLTETVLKLLHDG